MELPTESENPGPLTTKIIQNLNTGANLNAIFNDPVWNTEKDCADPEKLVEDIDLQIARSKPLPPSPQIEKTSAVAEPKPKTPPPLPTRPSRMGQLARSPIRAVSITSQAQEIPFPAVNTKQDSSSTVVEGTNTVKSQENDTSQTTSESSSQAVETNVDDTRQAHNRKFIGKWQLGKTIGEGSSGKVKLAKHMDTKETCVVKAVRRPKITNLDSNHTETDPVLMAKVYKRELYMIREACLGIMLQHPNIVRLHSAVLGENHFYCFFEHVEGEDLVDFISREGKMKETLARSIFRCVVSAVEYAHRNNVVHRDIKLENIRYNSKTGMVKLLDFGFATFSTDSDFLKTNCGSPCYAAPEIYDNKPYIGTLIDVWSLGVCLYGMVTGSLPFDGPDFKTLAARVRSGKVDFPKELSIDVCNLITGMLTTNPRRRFNLATVLAHTWVNIGYSTIPTDYLEHNRDREPLISLDWVKTLNSAGVCQAGCILMVELESRIPTRKLTQEITVTDANVDGSTDDDSTEEQTAEGEAEKFMSKMTIKDKKRSNIWWRRLWNTIENASRANLGKIFKRGNHLNAAELPYESLTAESSTSTTSTVTSSKKNHFRSITEALGFRPNSSSESGRKRPLWKEFRPRYRQ
ncbi:serine/threonine-protein kinase KIN2 [Boothiomyces macroporosus]|uniref:Serine/threonine-protein kinase KIN2 n=1 Tax=Boothiomyces macroporosus TaxID=261099 RepID=A0AAD5UK76_9FUNG|nr:serine/threonine-protein kinase KIN2 [Boothiomyces macroporosus]